MGRTKTQWVTVCLEGWEGEEMTLDCSYDIQPPEPDVNVAGGLVVTEVQSKGVTITHLLQPDELEAIEKLVSDEAYIGAGTDDGDWAYERMKEKRLGLD